MFRFAIVLALASFAATEVAATIPVGGTCATIAGPSSTPCVSGSICCYVGPDRGLCAAVLTCPSQFIAVNGTCSGIAGPSPYPCWPGTTCCTIGPDLSRCQASC